MLLRIFVSPRRAKRSGMEISMTIKLRVIIICGLLLVTLIMLNMVRKRKLELKYALSWVICAIILVLLTCIPSLLIHMADFLGIYSPVNMIFFLGFIFLLIVVFILTISLSRVTEKVRRLAQAEALTGKEAEEKRAQVEEAKNAVKDVTEVKKDK